MRLRALVVCLLASCLVLPAQTPAKSAPTAQSQPQAGHQKSGIPSPSEFLGFTVGADRVLADYKQITAYFAALDQASPRVEIENLGKTTLDNDMIMAVISAEENLRNAARYRDISRRLNNPQELKDDQIEALVREGKTILLITCNIHSTEIGASQMAMEWAHDLATTQDPKKLRWLSDVIVLLVPSLNPDGQIMVTDWYRKYLGTKYEGGAMPWLYHHYVGHDNNRDWYMLTQKETRAMNRAVYHKWFPHIWLDEHQMGSTGPRIFMPPYADPIAESLNPLIFRNINVIGTNMALRLEQAGKSGAIYGYVFDAYWPGGTRNTAWWKNIFGLLTEVASPRIATPIEVAPGELTGGGKGLVEYKRQINFPNPWPGGTWRLRDVMDYELIISNAALETASNNREDFLRGTARLAREAVSTGNLDTHWTISLDRSSGARLASLMHEHGVKVLFHGSQALIPTAQPYAKFVEEMFSSQRYPEVKPVAGPNIMPPYDVAAWSLPLMFDVEVRKEQVSPEVLQQARPWAERRINDPFDGNPGTNANTKFTSYSAGRNKIVPLVNEILSLKGDVLWVKEAGEQSPFAGPLRELKRGSFVFSVHPRLMELKAKYGVEIRFASQFSAATKLRLPRVAIYKPWVASMDEGWTRWVLEQYGFDPKALDNKAVKAGNLRASYDAIVLPDIAKETILDGRVRRRSETAMRYTEEFPPEYAGGIGREGVASLKKFVEDGGTIIALSSSSELLMDEFNIPVRNALAGAKPEDFLQPGSLLRVHLDTNHPVAYGMPDEVAAFLDESIAFQTALPGPDLSRTVVGWYPDDENDILLSGWMRGGEKLERRAAIVALTQGKGKLVLFGIRPQHRAQTEATFRLLFNSLYWSVME